MEKKAVTTDEELNTQAINQFTLGQLFLYHDSTAAGQSFYNFQLLVVLYSLNNFDRFRQTNVKLWSLRQGSRTPQWENWLTLLI